MKGLLFYFLLNFQMVICEEENDLISIRILPLENNVILNEFWNYKEGYAFMKEKDPNFYLLIICDNCSYDVWSAISFCDDRNARLLPINNEHARQQWYEIFKRLSQYHFGNKTNLNNTFYTQSMLFVQEEEYLNFEEEEVELEDDCRDKEVNSQMICSVYFSANTYVEFWGE